MHMNQSSDHRLDVVLAEDEGEYRCTVKREQHFVHRTIRLKVKEPTITLYVVEVRIFKLFKMFKTIQFIQSLSL